MIGEPGREPSVQQVTLNAPRTKVRSAMLLLDVYDPVHIAHLSPAWHADIYLNGRVRINSSTIANVSQSCLFNDYPSQSEVVQDFQIVR